MKDNTYIIPAIDFYVAVPKFKCYSLEYINLQMKKDCCFYIPFSQVDGLTIEELLEMDNFQKGFAVCAINLIEDKGLDYVFKKRNVLNILFFPSIEKSSNIDISERIDKLVERSYELSYLDADDKSKQIYNCFFEKYQDGDYQKTKERVNKLLGKSRR